MWFQYKCIDANIKQLLNSQGMPISHIKALPELGVTVFEDGAGVPIAAGFLRTIEADPTTVMLDGLITNKNASPSLRDQALNAVVAELIIIAKVRGITNILAFSTDKNTLMRAERFGFVELSHQVISLAITS